MGGRGGRPRGGRPREGRPRTGRPQTGQPPLLPPTCLECLEWVLYEKAHFKEGPGGAFTCPNSCPAVPPVTYLHSNTPLPAEEEVHLTRSPPRLPGEEPKIKEGLSEHKRRQVDLQASLSPVKLLHLLIPVCSTNDPKPSVCTWGWDAEAGLKLQPHYFLFLHRREGR